MHMHQSGGRIVTQPSAHPDAGAPAFEEHRIESPSGDVYARDYPGDAPAFVLEPFGFLEHRAANVVADVA